MIEEPTAASASRIELRPGPSSPALARRFLNERSEAWSLPDPVGEQLVLVGSELVTNAVLHARTQLTLTLELRADRVRVSVRDHSSAPVALRHYRPDALTGRGLGVIATVSRAWGVEPARGGKVIWAELLLDGSSPSTPASPPERGQVDGPKPSGAPGARRVMYLDVPVTDYLAMQEHNDALFRELQLIRIRMHTQGGEGAAVDPPRLVSFADRLLTQFRSQSDTLRDEVARAQARGAETVDLESEGFPAAVPAARAHVDLLEEADEFCRSGELLVPPPPERVRWLRRWFLEQMATQLLDGAPPGRPDGGPGAEPGADRPGPA